MSNFYRQTQRIKEKLVLVAEKDRDFSVFGAGAHKYSLSPAISEIDLASWQEENGISLPDAFASFFTDVGNGDAGPYYGVYSLSEMKPRHTCGLPCSLHPKMPREDWNSLIAPLLGDDTPDNVYEAAEDQVFGGMLEFGTRGCEYNMYIVLEGQHRGRIVYTDDIYKDHPFFFVYEENFLDWYERWLDEILAGYDVSGFGYKLSGDEQALMQAYNNANTIEERLLVLDSMSKFPAFSPDGIDFLKTIANGSQGDRNAAIQLICTVSLSAGEPYILELLHSDNRDDYLCALKLLNWYGQNSSLDVYLADIRRGLPSISDEETLRHAGYVLEHHGVLTIDDFLPFLIHSDSKMQSAAIYATKLCPHKETHWKTAAGILKSGDSKAIRNFVLYWDIVPHRNLLPHYKAIWPEYRDNPNFRAKFLDCLRVLGLPEDYFDT